MATYSNNITQKINRTASQEITSAASFSFTVASGCYAEFTLYGRDSAAALTISINGSSITSPDHLTTYGNGGLGNNNSKLLLVSGDTLSISTSSLQFYITLVEFSNTP